MIHYLMRELVANLAIITAVSVFMHFIFRKRDGSPFKSVHDINPGKITLSSRFLIGFAYGLIGILIMFYGIRLSLDSGPVVDLRHLPIMMSALFGGVPSALLTGIIISFSRLAFIGEINLSSVVGAINAINMAIGCGFISNYVVRRKWSLMTAYCLVSISIVGFILISSLSQFATVLVIFYLVSIPSAILVYFVMNYLLKSSAAQKEIIESEERYRLITENMSDILAVLDTTGRILYASQSHTQLGIDPDSYRDTFPHPYIHPDDLERVRTIFREVVKNRDILMTDCRWKHKDGRWIHIEMRGTPIEEDGMVTKMVIVSRDITERKRLERKLEYLSNIDGLTGIANRRYFDKELLEYWRGSSHLSLIMLDIDYFKKYNDTYGHQVGDECLKKVAITIKDFASPNLAARYGGEEFAVILPNVREEEAMQIAENIRVEIERLAIPHTASERYKSVTVSIGVAALQNPEGRSPQELIEKADQSLYQAKQAGRNQVCCHH